jgi:hypothetical protein
MAGFKDLPKDRRQMDHFEEVAMDVFELPYHAYASAKHKHLVLVVTRNLPHVFTRLMTARGR